MLAGFSAAQTHARELPNSFVAPFALERAVDAALAAVAALRSSGRGLLAATAEARDALRQRWRHEGALYHLIDREARSDWLCAPQFQQARAEFDRKRG